MKLTPILMCLLLASMSLNAQDDTSPPSARNEVRLNAIHTLIGFGELTYERSFGADMSVGVSVGGRLDSEIEWLWGVTPFFRAYFGDIGGPIFKTNHDGFFFEANAAFGQREANWWAVPYSSIQPTEPIVVDVAGMGFAIGYKATHNGWVADAYGGAGRNFIQSNSQNAQIYPRFGVSLGRMF